MKIDKFSKAQIATASVSVLACIHAFVTGSFTIPVLLMGISFFVYKSLVEAEREAIRNKKMRRRLGQRA